MAASTDEDEIHKCQPSTSNLDEKKFTDVVDKRKVFLFGAASVTVLLGFGASIFRARRQDPLFFAKMRSKGVSPEEGSKLAFKALGVATVISVTSFSLMVMGTFKLFGVSDFHGFHAKMREYFPMKESKGKVDFKDLRELADYLISEDRKAELAKKKAAKDQS